MTLRDGLIRDRVNIDIECPREDVYAVMSYRAKPGSQPNRSLQTISTWVYVEDATQFEIFLTYKYKETHFCWTSHEKGAELTETEAHELRRSARIAAENL